MALGVDRGDVLQAAQEAVAELTREQGGDPAAWSEPVETGAFSAQGAISVAPLSRLPSRGSYAQLVEATG